VGTLTDSFLAEFDLVNGPGGSCSIYNPLLAGNNYIFAVAPFRTGSGSPGNMAVVESAELGVSDTYYGNTIQGGQMPLADHGRSQDDGRVGYKLVGTPQ
jgi:hypothetical protein